MFRSFSTFHPGSTFVTARSCCPGFESFLCCLQQVQGIPASFSALNDNPCEMRNQNVFSPGQDTCLHVERGLTQPVELLVNNCPDFDFWGKPVWQSAPESHCGRYFSSQTSPPPGAPGSFQGRQGQMVVWGISSKNKQLIRSIRFSLQPLTHCCHSPRLSKLSCSSSCIPPGSKSVLNINLCRTQPQNPSCFLARCKNCSTWEGALQNTDHTVEQKTIKINPILFVFSI